MVSGSPTRGVAGLVVTERLGLLASTDACCRRSKRAERKLITAMTSPMSRKVTRNRYCRGGDFFLAMLSGEIAPPDTDKQGVVGGK